MPSDKLLQEAEMIMQTVGVRKALGNLREHLMADIAQTAVSMYKELVDVGMTQEQAHDIAKAYVLEFCSLDFEEEESFVYEDEWIDDYDE